MIGTVKVEEKLANTQKVSLADKYVWIVSQIILLQNKTSPIPLSEKMINWLRWWVFYQKCYKTLYTIYLLLIVGCLVLRSSPICCCTLAQLFRHTVSDHRIILFSFLKWHENVYLPWSAIHYIVYQCSRRAHIS